MEDSKTTLKRMPVGKIQLMFAGDLILAQCPDMNLSGLFKRYKVLFEMLANLERDERILNYKMINALMLTSHAKKTEDPELKKDLFAKKNEIFMNIANNFELRKKVKFTYLTSKNFRITKYCASCTKKNEEEKLKKFNWKFCKNCEFDRKFYNVVSMVHKFNNGGACIFLSNDLVDQLPFKKFKFQGKLEETAEEATFLNYHYNVKNLDSISVESTLKMFDKFSKK